MKKLMLLTAVAVAVAFSAGVYAAEKAAAKTEEMKPADIEKAIKEKKDALAKEQDAEKKAALEKEIKELEAKLPKKAE